MPMYITLESYLSGLRAMESRQPEGKRRDVPSLTELAHSIGMHQTSLSRIANNRVNQLSLDTGSKIITEMRRRGFEMQVTDLIAYQEEQ